MPIICPKCSHIRQPNESAPDWQCPACGVAYAKVNDGGPPVSQARSSSVRSTGVPAPEGRSIPWGKLILIAALIWGGWTGMQVAKNKRGASYSVDTSMNKDISAAGLAALAATVKPGDVVMYSTTECPYCAQAKGWLNQYGFAFAECNMSVNADCEREFKNFGANGTPYMLVRGQHMKDGFDSDEFVALLKK